MTFFYLFSNTKSFFALGGRRVKASHLQFRFTGFSTGLLIFILLLSTAEVLANGESEGQTNPVVAGDGEAQNAEVTKALELAVSKTTESLKQTQYYIGECTRSITRVQKAHAHLKGVMQKYESFLKLKQTKTIPQDILAKASEAAATAKVSVEVIERDFLPIIDTASQKAFAYYDVVQLKSVEVLSKAREIREYIKPTNDNPDKQKEIEKLLLEAKTIAELAWSNTVVVRGVVEQSIKVALKARMMASQSEKVMVVAEDALLEVQEEIERAKTSTTRKNDSTIVAALQSILVLFLTFMFLLMCC